MFTIPDTWTGGYIEFIVVLGPSSVDQLHNALCPVWKWPKLQGPFTDRTIEPSEQTLTPITLEGLQYGCAEVPVEMQVAFVTSIITFDEGDSWLSASIPVGSLGKAYPIGGWPFGRSATDLWVLEVYEWFYELAEYLYNQVQFQRGIIGWEASSDTDKWLDQARLPEQRYDGYIVVTNDGLAYLAPNATGPLCTIE